jgi:hypothetical protein
MYRMPCCFTSVARAINNHTPAWFTTPMSSRSRKTCHSPKLYAYRSPRESHQQAFQTHDNRPHKKGGRSLSRWRRRRNVRSLPWWRIVVSVGEERSRGNVQSRSAFVTMMKTTDTRPCYYFASPCAARSLLRWLLLESTMGAVLVVVGNV